MIAKKIPAHKWSKKDLQGLYAVVAPEWTIIEAEGFTTKVEKTGKITTSVRIKVGHRNVKNDGGEGHTSPHIY